MYINRLRLLNVKPLHRDIPNSGDALPEPARRRFVLQGANGSGKSTILETIATLWKFWGDWLEEGRGAAPPPEQLSHYLGKAELAAIEIVGITGASRPLWIGMGKPSEWQGLRMMYPKSAFAGLIQHGTKWVIEFPGDAQRPEPDDLLTRRYRSLAGSESFPNMVYFPPEGRTIRRPKKLRGEIMDTTGFHWTAVYDPHVNLDSVLLTVRALWPERFEECLALVNLALEHRQKRITGFGPKGRLIVKGTTDWGAPYEHPIEALSSGERQMLLLVGFAVAFLRPGGIVLLDEPDLHLHLGMVDQLLETIERVVQERHGQLIVASHSVRVWEWFARPEEQIDLDACRSRNQ
ncbi:MAG: AAA family ATPase [Planctomycetes bacterium]|nr:AAA family ATPase [Planctomycetota bacterium]